MERIVAPGGEETIAASFDELPVVGVEPLAAALKVRHRARITGELVVPARNGSYAELPPKSAGSARAP